MKTIIGMAKINWRHSKVAYLITGITFAVGFLQYIIDLTVNPPDNVIFSAGNYMYLLPLCMGIFVAALNFPKLMNLGGKRMDFFKSGFITYLVISAASSLVCMATYFTVNKWMLSNSRIAGMLDLYDIFGFMSRGAIIAFFQAAAFMLLIAVTAHTLTLIQGIWYGWVTNVVIIAIISVFTPIAPLRAALVWFFNMIIFNKNAALQIISCLITGIVIYSASIVPIKSRQL